MTAKTEFDRSAEEYISVLEELAQDDFEQERREALAETVGNPEAHLFIVLALMEAERRRPLPIRTGRRP